MTAQTNTVETQKSDKGMALGKGKQTALAKLFSSLLTEARSVEKKSTDFSAKALIKEVPAETKGGDKASKNTKANPELKVLDLKKSNKKESEPSSKLGMGAKAQVETAEATAFLNQKTKATFESADQKAKNGQNLQIKGEQGKVDSPDSSNRTKRRGRLEEADSTGTTLVALLAGSTKKPDSGSVKKSEAGDEKVEAASSKKQEKRKERLALEVHDFRTAKGSEESKEAALPISSTDKKVAETELTVHLHSEGSNADGTETKTSRTSNSPTSFANVLAQELRENANADIVRHASMVLRDGGEGLIRLSLKPESLGAVKIRLEMTDNKIAGRIIVESEDALKAFEKELRSLEQAFLDGGFDGASLELAVSSDGARGGSGNPAEQDGPKPFFSDRIAASTYDAALSTKGIQESSSISSQTVNMLA